MSWPRRSIGQSVALTEVLGLNHNNIFFSKPEMWRILGVVTLLTAVWGCAMTAGVVQPDQKIEGDRPGNMRTERILFLGNSITRHEPARRLGWTNDWGMAASALEKDYVHLLLDRFSGSHKRRPEAMIGAMGDFERKYDSCDVASLAKKYADFKADVVILAIGENVPSLATADAKAKFRQAVAGLLEALRRDAAPAIFVRSCFWPEPVRAAILREVCEAVGGVFVDISAIGRDESNHARSERKFQHDGVAAHPGDKGMKAIADAIWKALPKETH